MTTDFSSETIEARKEGGNILQVLKEKNCEFRIQYSLRISFKNEEEKSHSKIETKRMCGEKTCPKRIDTECFLKRKKSWNIGKGGITKERVNINIYGKCNRFFPDLESSKLCLDG